jgi:hypothetical protein
MHLETRDLEILRTLARLYFVTSAELNAAFFTNERPGFRRLSHLAGLDLIRRHTRGLPPRSTYCAWRITGRGIEALGGDFPEELVPEGLETRLAAQSLADLEHREATTRVYLDLIGGPSGDRVDEASRGAVQRWIATVRHRASQLEWQADGAVVFEFRDHGENFRLVPDATATSTTKPIRLFVEVDRSNKGLHRIEENIKRYARLVRRHYAEFYEDDKVPWIVYLAQTRARREGVARLAANHLGGCEWQVLPVSRVASDWLAARLLDEQRGRFQPEPEPLDVFRSAAIELLKSTSDLLKRDPAAVEALADGDPELLMRWKKDLRALYQHMQEAGYVR